VGLNNEGAVFNRNCPVELGSGSQYAKNQQQQESNFNAIAAGGSEFFFTTNVETGKNCGSGTVQVFVRLGGAKTLEVSTCGRGVVSCERPAKRASAYFKGASEDGSRVFFTTTAPLTGEGEGENLYMATVGCLTGTECGVAERQVTSLVRVSRGSIGSEAAEVQGVTRVAPDGSRVYFVALGVLSEGANAQGAAPVTGADNLYVYDRASEKVMFVADLCSGPALSGTTEDVRCPGDLEAGAQVAKNDRVLWRGSSMEAQTNGCPEASSGCEAGRFLVFSTYAQLVPNDTDDAKDVYRYDAETGALERVSIGEDDYGANGNADGSANDATIALGHLGNTAQAYLQDETSTRAISEDGTRIVFTSAGPLSPDATNGRANVYEWHEGSVSLVSSGSAEGIDSHPVISPSGRDIFFATSQGLTSQDTDGVADVYDARLGGGFPPVPAERQPCSGDACQGPLTNPAPLLVPGSVPQAPGQNFAAPVSTTTVKSKTKPKPAKCRKGYVRKKGRCVKRPKKSAKGKK
jgi:hypothetical protein